MTLFRRRRALDIDAPSASRFVTDNKATLLDVREAEEWDAGHAPDAVHMPLGNVVVGTVTSANLIIAVCRSGRRSGQAAAVLRKEGFDVRNLSGGMRAWTQAGLPVVREDGSTGIIT